MKTEPFENTVTGLLTDLVRMFTFHHADLEIKGRCFSSIVNISWRGNQGDRSRMIGEDGLTHKRLAKLLRLIGQHHGYEVELERVGESVVGVNERYDNFKAKANWRQAEITALIERTAVLATKAGLAEVTSGVLGEDKTGFKISIAKSETLNTLTVMRETLQHIFNVIGNANGRVIRIDVVRELEPEAAQPAAADGRFARERK